MGKKIFVGCLSYVLAALLVCATANAGLLKGLVGGDKSAGGTTVSTDGLVQAWTTVAKNYVKSTSLLVSSLENAGAALGVKEEVVKKMAVAKSLTEGNLSKKDMEKIQESSKDLLALFNQKMSEVSPLKGQSATLFGKSIIDMTASLGLKAAVGLQATKLAKDSKDASKNVSLKDAGTMKDVVSGSAAVAIVVPVDIKLSKDILKSYVQYAKTHNIAVPNNATKLLKD